MFYTITVDGKTIRVNNGGKQFQEDMERRGWRLRIRNGYNESLEDMYLRLSKEYSKVKLYWTGTMIPGIHNFYAFCK